MKKEWPKARLGEVLRQVDRSEAIDASRVYRLMGVRWYGQGLFVREEKIGADIAANRVYSVKAGDFVYNRLFAWKGSFAIAGPESHEAYVSNEFPCFLADRTRVDPYFLFWLFREERAWTKVLGLSTGATPTSRNRLKESVFLALDIPLPPLAEQRRVVARVEQLAAQIHEARTLRQQAGHDVEDMFRRAAATLLDDVGWPRVPLGEVLAESPRNGLSPRPEAGPGGRPMLRINAVSSSPTRFVDLGAVKQVQVSDEEARPFVLQHDDVFIVRYNGDINRVAKAAIYKESDSSPVVFPDKLMRLRPDRSKMLPDFLVLALSARTVREQIEEIGKTTAGNIGISGGNAKSFLIPLPPVSSQGQIVVKLEALQAEVDSVKRLQVQTAGELDALLPAILDRAFKGEL